MKVLSGFGATLYNFHPDGGQRGDSQNGPTKIGLL